MTKEINYQTLWDKKQAGERDIDIAASVGKSVTSLYSHWDALGLLPNSEIDWEDEYDNYLTNKTPLTQIAKDLNISRNTVYNHFIQLGMKVRERPEKSTDINALLFDRKNGLSISELSVKYQITPTYVRSLIRKNIYK